MELQNKKRLKALLAGYERDSTVVLAQGFILHRANNEILASVRKELQKYSRLCRLRKDEVKILWNGSFRTLARMNRSIWGKRNSTDIYQMLKRQLIYSREFTKIKNLIANRHEEQDKKEYISDLLEKSESPFYLSDTHKHCSKAHKPYENRIYYDKNFKTAYGLSFEEIEMVSEYIAKHRLMSVQEVTGEGIWLITRPNCGHRLHPVALDAVLHGKRIQKIDGVPDLDKKQSYEQGEMEFYYERKRILEALRDVIPCNELEKDLKNTTILVNRWRKIKKNREL